MAIHNIILDIEHVYLDRSGDEAIALLRVEVEVSFDPGARHGTSVCRTGRRAALISADGADLEDIDLDALVDEEMERDTTYSWMVRECREQMDLTPGPSGKQRETGEKT